MTEPKAESLVVVDGVGEIGAILVVLSNRNSFSA